MLRILFYVPQEEFDSINEEAISTPLKASSYKMVLISIVGVGTS